MVTLYADTHVLTPSDRTGIVINSAYHLNRPQFFVTTCTLWLLCRSTLRNTYIQPVSSKVIYSSAFANCAKYKLR
jgi:hypothetical protein